MKSIIEAKRSELREALAEAYRSALLDWLEYRVYIDGSGLVQIVDCVPGDADDWVYGGLGVCVASFHFPNVYVWELARAAYGDLPKGLSYDDAEQLMDSAMSRMADHIVSGIDADALIDACI